MDTSTTHNHNSTDLITTKDAAERFLTAKRVKGLSPRTLETYTYRLRILSKAIPDLPSDPEPLERFLESVGPTLETRETYYRLLRNLYRWLVARKAIDGAENPVPAIEAPRIPRRIARSLEPEELRQLLTHPEQNENVKAFLFLLVDTGLRLSEAFSVNVESFRGRLAVVEGKTGAREVPVTPEVRERVLATLPWPWATPGAAGLAVRRAFKRAGFTGKRASAHTLRHTFVRLWKGDESLLVGIMGWTSARMLTVYRPYNVAKATEEHRENTPIKLANLGAGEVQKRLI